MTSKHHRWQTRWQVDVPAGRATHDTGLVVEFVGTEHEPQAVNLAELEPALTAKHCPHNVPPMVARWLREASQLFERARSQ